MPFNIQQFRGQMTGDGARPNLFECTITFPLAPGVISSPQGAQTKYTFFARSAQLPGSSVNSVPVNYFGRELKFAGNRVFSDWAVTIINDEDFVIRNAFEQWMNGLNSHRINLRDSGLYDSSQYQQDGYVKHFGKRGEVLKAYKFVGMFPVDLSPIDLDWAANDSIEEYSVTFAYQWWEVIPGDQSSTQNDVVI